MPAGISGGIVEFFAPGDRTTVVSSGSITGGSVVALVATKKVAVAGVGNVPYGVALHDAANGEALTVAHVGIWPVVASATISTAGVPVICAAAGQVSPVTGTYTTPLLVVGKAFAPIDQNVAGPVRLTV